MPGLKVIVAETEVDPGFANAAITNIFHRSKAVARNIKSLTLHAQIPVVSHSHHSFLHRFTARGTGVASIAIRAAWRSRRDVHLNRAPVFDADAIHSRGLHLYLCSVAEDPPLRGSDHPFLFCGPR